MIQSTEAFVLSAKNYSESSKIVQLFTKDFGKFSAIAKGASSPKSKFGRLLQSTNYLRITFYQKNTNQLQLLTDAEIIENFWNVQNIFDSTIFALAIIETINKLFEDYYVNKSAFELTCEVFKMLNNKFAADIVFIYFLLNLMDKIGYTIDLDYSILLTNHDKYYFDLQNGTFYDIHRKDTIEISRSLFGKIFAIKLKNDNLNDINLTKREFFTLINMFQKYIREHTEKLIFWESLGMLQ